MGAGARLEYRVRDAVLRRFQRRRGDAGRPRRITAARLATIAALLAHVLPLRAEPPDTAVPAAWAAAQSAICSAAVAEAERRHGIPSGLLLAIAKVESGRPLPPRGALGPWPWTTNADGAGSFYDTPAAAVAGGRDALRRSRNLDVGCMQVSLLHHPAAFASLEDAFEPALNADYAARFLVSLQEGAAGGDWRVAAGFYHSQTPALASAYRAQVEAVLAGLPPPRGDPPFYHRAVQRGAVRLDLAGGAVRIVRVSTGGGRPGGCKALPGGAAWCRARQAPSSAPGWTQPSP